MKITTYSPAEHVKPFTTAIKCPTCGKILTEYVKLNKVLVQYTCTIEKKVFILDTETDMLLLGEEHD